MKTQETFENEQVQQAEEQDTFQLNTDENISGSQHLNEPLEESEVEKLKSELQQLNDKYLRLVAEFENFRRRTAKERIELIQTAGREVIIDLLEVMGDADRAQKQMDTTEDVQQIKEGVQLVFTKLRNSLAIKGLKAMESVNQPFDPHLHEAISEIDAGKEMKGKVVAEIQKGYYLNDKIIRFAKVVVGK